MECCLERSVTERRRGIRPAVLERWAALCSRSDVDEETEAMGQWARRVTGLQRHMKGIYFRELTADVRIGS